MDGQWSSVTRGAFLVTQIKNVTDSHRHTHTHKKKKRNVRPCAPLALERLCHGSYLGVVLEHLIALHVVTLEHDDGPVQAGHVQAEVVCPDFFVRRVGEDLGKRPVKRKKNISEGTKQTGTLLSFYDHLFCFIYEPLFQEKQPEVCLVYLSDFGGIIMLYAIINSAI